MSPAARLAALSLLVFAAATGCAQAVDPAAQHDTVVDLQDRNSDSPSSSSSNDSAAVPGVEASAAKPVYFNETNYVEGTPDKEASYTFDLLENSQIAIHLARATETGPQQVGFTLYRATANDKGVVLGEVMDDDGSADAQLWSEHGGTYVIEIAGGESPASLVLDLSCLSGTCSKYRQPGQVCGTADPYLCAPGLVCRFADGQCKAGDTPAKCQIPPSSCTNVHVPVCGCDGQTWGNECFARSAGVSVLSSGECAGGK